MSDTIEYVAELDGIEPSQLRGFFVGWAAVPTAEQHLAFLRGSDHVVLARHGDRVVGYVTAVSDGVVSAFIPLFEVVEDHQGRGIGTELMRRLLAQLKPMYMVDLCCDVDLEPFYTRLGFRVWDRGMGMRRPAVLTMPRDQVARLDAK
ncbi:MAG: GNAT family N-acetyltransferase [Gaiellaceae bacterium]